MGSGFAKKKKQARGLQEQMMKLQQSFASKMDAAEVEGKAGNGLVTITLSGSGEMKRVKISPECVDPEDIEGLEALIKAAYNQASTEIQKLSENSPSIDGLKDLAGF